MDDKLNIILDCMKEIQKDNMNNFGKTMVIKVNELSNKIDYNFIAKAYDIIYNINQDDLSTEELVRILNLNNITYSYRGEVINQSAIPIFQD